MEMDAINIDKMEKSNQKMTKKQNVWQVIKFALFSASAGIIQFGSFTLLTQLTEWDYIYRYLPSLVLSVLWNFTFNRSFTLSMDFLNDIPLRPLSIS